MSLYLPGHPPVSTQNRKSNSTKAWLEDQADLIARGFQILAVLNGGLTGRVAYLSVGQNSLAVEGQGDLTVEVQTGLGFFEGIPLGLDAVQSITVGVPVTNDRIDRVSWDVLNKVAVLTVGVESATPSAPGVPENHLDLATILARTTMLKVLEPGDSDDSTNAVVTNADNFINT